MSSLKMVGEGGEFVRGFFTPFPLVRGMRRVLHVGPCDTPGGMATVMHTLAEFPPEGWEAELLASHAPGGLWTKWRAYRRARRELKRRCSDPALRPDVVHVHTAADWSWRRKARLIRLVPSSIGVVIHVHSGKFHSWLGTASSGRCSKFRQLVEEKKATVVVLSESWQALFASNIGTTQAISNPLHPRISASDIEREQDHLLLLGRPDPVKGHDVAIELVRKLRTQRPNVQLSITGIEDSSEEFIHALGWVSEEEKLRLLRTASLLLLPSSYEGQPMVALEASACGLPIVASTNLSSLPPSTVFAGPDIEHWVSVVAGLLEQPPMLSPVDASVQLRDVQHKWNACYESITHA